MRYMVQCLRELAVLALRCGKYEDAPRYLEKAAELDRKIKSGIIENRYNDGSHYTKDEHGHFTGSTGYASGGSGGGGADRQTTTNAAGQTVRIVSHIDLKDEPNSITQLEGKNGRIDRNYYGSDGMQIIQICNSDHGHPKQHPFGKHGEHAHDYKFDHSGELISRIPRELTDEERKDNSDIL